MTRVVEEVWHNSSQLLSDVFLPLFQLLGMFDFASNSEIYSIILLITKTVLHKSNTPILSLM